MMIDFVAAFDIITADGVYRTITKPESQNISPDNDDLWFAVLGGSPGNIGVVTQVKVNVRWDRDYPCKGMFLMLPFTKQSLKAALDVVAEVNDNPNLPSDYNFNVMAFSKGSQHKYGLDQSIRDKFPDIYGAAQEDKVLGIRLGDLEQGILPQMIVVTAVYISTQEKNLKKADEWLADIDEKLKHYKPPLLSVYTIMNFAFGITDYKKTISMSTINEKCVFRWVREYVLPFEKHVWAGTSTNLKGIGFAEWAAAKCWELASNDENGCYLASQFIAYGAKNNMVADNKNPSALGHRVAAKNSCAFDFFYDFERNGKPWPEPHETGKRWLESVSNTGIGANGKYSPEDLRFLYCPWGDSTSPWGHNTNLDEMWRYYYDDEKVYRTLLDIKRRLDPDHVFTPNSFCVGYNDMLATGRMEKDPMLVSEGDDVVRKIDMLATGRAEEETMVVSEGGPVGRVKDAELIAKVYGPRRENLSFF
jgi:hypothetical protein